MQIRVILPKLWPTATITARIPMIPEQRIALKARFSILRIVSATTYQTRTETKTFMLCARVSDVYFPRCAPFHIVAVMPFNPSWRIAVVILSDITFVWLNILYFLIPTSDSVTSYAREDPMMSPLPPIELTGFNSFYAFYPWICLDKGLVETRTW